MSLQNPEKMNAQLREDNEVLREKLCQMEKEFFGRHLVAPPEWGLTIQQEMLACALAKRGHMTYDQATVAVEKPRSQDEGVDMVHLRVLIHYIRRKIKPFGFTISTNWGVGFFVDDNYRAAFTEIDV